MDVGFLGLGAMGRPISQNLARAGHRVRAWSRSAKPGDDESGITIVASAAEVFDADVIFTVLPDDASIRDTVLTPGVLRGARRGAVHAVISTISLAFVEELRAAHAEAGVGYVATPVFGRPDVAQVGALHVLLAGDAAAREKVRPLLDAIGKKTWQLGDDPQKATAAKIAGNMMITMAIEAMAEAVVLTEDNGLGKATFLELMTQTLFGGRVYETYSAQIIEARYEPGFRMKLGLKDLNLAEAAAEKSGKRLPMLDAVHARMSEAVKSGMGEKDWSAIAEYAARSR